MVCRDATKQEIAVVLTDATHPSADEVAEALARSGEIVVYGLAGEHAPISPAFTGSRSWCEGEEGVAEWIEGLCSEHRATIVLPWSDRDCERLLRLRHRVPDALVPMPPPATVDLVADKLEVGRVLSAEGVAVVLTIALTSETTDAAISALAAQSPVGILRVKPRFGSGSNGHFVVGETAHGAMPTLRPAVLRALLDHEPLQPLVAQPENAGADMSVDFLAWEGRLDTVIVRSRNSALGGTATSGCVTSAPPPAYLALCTTLSERLHWSGPGNVQLFQQGTTLAVYDVNPRLSGGVAAADLCGVRMYERAVRLALHGNADPGRNRHDGGPQRSSALYRRAFVTRAIDA